MMTVEQALAYIHSVSWMGSVPGLGRTRELLHRMGDPQNDLKFIHIAGTNGKGSTAAMLASVLKQAGYTTGLYTSPYILRFHERMKVDGVDISDGELCEITEFVKPHAEAMAQHPTEFELVTAIAFEFFKRRGCDIVVLEVGMGGALDSTNVIDAPEAAVITNIGLDHTKVLGDTVEEIAATKAGIIKPGTVCVLYGQTQGVERVIEGVCAQKNVPLRLARVTNVAPGGHGLDGQSFDWKHLRGIRIPLLGAHQLNNAGVVLETLMVLRERGWEIPDEAIYKGMAEVSWPGRFQVMRREPLFIIDGGHNPQCLEALVHAIEDYLPERKLVFLSGCMADKDYGAMFEALVPFAKAFVTVTPDNPRALNARTLASHLKRYALPVTACETVADGVHKAVELAGESGAVCCCGSLYMISEICAAL